MKWNDFMGHLKDALDEMAEYITDTEEALSNLKDEHEVIMNLIEREEEESER